MTLTFDLQGHPSIGFFPMTYIMAVPNLVKIGPKLFELSCWHAFWVIWPGDLDLWPFDPKKGSATKLLYLVLISQYMITLLIWQHSKKCVTDIFKHNCIVMMIDDDSSAYSESFTRVECTSREDRRVRATSSAPGTTDPFCGFCLVTTPNTRGETVEQSLYMGVCARIYNE